MLASVHFPELLDTGLRSPDGLIPTRNTASECDLARSICEMNPAALKGNEWWEEKLRVIVP